MCNGRWKAKDEKSHSFFKKDILAIAPLAL